MFQYLQLMSDMFEKMENSFMYGDLHLFINVINGVTLMHCENVNILRCSMATYLSMAVRFSTLFASQVNSVLLLVFRNSCFQRFCFTCNSKLRVFPSFLLSKLVFSFPHPSCNYRFNLLRNCRDFFL